MSELFTVAWVSTTTGDEGGGTAKFTAEYIDRIVELLNQKTPGVVHWKVKARDDVQPTQPARDGPTR